MEYEVKQFAVFKEANHDSYDQVSIWLDSFEEAIEYKKDIDAWFEDENSYILARVITKGE